MYSPKRNEPNIERNDVMSSPLRALTPIVDVIKTAQTNASRDFDRFYDNLWAKITPRTSNSRLRKTSPERMERNKIEMDDHSASSRTSLTPLIERHSLREDSRASYGYTSRDPFYQDAESDIGDTPGLERGVESPSSFLSYTPTNAPTINYTPFNVSHSPRRSMVSHKSTHIPSSPRRSLLFSSNYMNQKFEEERKKMDKLQESVTHIRRQSSLLAEKSSRMASFLFDDDDDEEEEEEDIPSRNNIQRTPQQQISHQLATPPYSTDYNKTKTHHQFNSTPRYHQQHHYNNNTTSPPVKRHRSTSQSNVSPVAKRLATPSAKCMSPSPKRLIVSPKRIIIEDLPGAKLRSTEMITTPGGTMVSNRFWKEIHGLNNNTDRSPTSTPTTPIKKRISTLQQRASTSQTWANDDQFWSSESSPAPSSLNNKLLQIAQQEKRQQRQEQERKENDMQWSIEAPVTSSSNHDFFSQEEEEEEDYHNREASPTPSLFKNKLFKAASHKEREPTRLSFSDRLLQLAERDETPNNKRLSHHEQSLSDELESAKKRDDILKRNNIPKMNPALLEELKAKHHAKLIDDSDSYKFT